METWTHQIITRSGAVYWVDLRSGTWRRNFDEVDAIIDIISVPSEISRRFASSPQRDLVYYLNSQPDLQRLPMKGERMYIKGNETGWYSTTVEEVKDNLVEAPADKEIELTIAQVEET